MFSAATVRDFATKQYMINQVHEYAASMQNRTPISGYYSPSNGIAFSSPGAGKNRCALDARSVHASNPLLTEQTCYSHSSPAIGGIFALLALKYAVPLLNSVRFV